MKMARFDNLVQRGAFVAAALLAAMALTAAMPGIAAAQESDSGNDWHFGANLYIWSIYIGGSTVNGSEIDVDASDVIENLEMAFMGTAVVGRGKWTFLVDLLYLNLADDRSATGTLREGGLVEISLDGDLDLKAWVVTPAVSYRVFENERLGLDVLAGARYLWMDADVNLEVTAPALLAREREFNKSGEVWDAIVGARGEVALAEKWFVPFHFDVGTGQTDMTWQAFGGAGYRFGKVDVVVAYRYLSWDFEDDSEVLDDLNVSGPLAGVRIRF
jgi:hypothetical protein